MKLKKKKQYVSKSEITAFLLFYDYDYLKVKQYLLLSLSFIILLALRMGLQPDVNFLIVEIVCISVIVTNRFTLIRKKAIKIKELDYENINQLKLFFETSGEKRKKNFKNLVEKLETAHNNHYKLYFYEFIAKITLIGTIMFFGFLILYEFIAFNFFNVIINLRVQIAEYLSTALIISTVLINFFLFRVVEYRNVDKIKKWFKYYIDEKLSNITTNIKKFIQSSNAEISKQDHGLIADLNKWYHYYCAHFSSSNELNNLFKSYKDLIFDREEELFYIDDFSNLKARINNYIQYFKQKEIKNDTEIESLNSLLEILNNYIRVLDFNINTKKERLYQKREKRKSQQTVLNLILGPTSFVISIISISLNFII